MKNLLFLFIHFSFFLTFGLEENKTDFSSKDSFHHKLQDERNLISEENLKHKSESDSTKQNLRKKLILDIQGEWKLVSVTNGFANKKARKIALGKHKGINISSNKIELMDTKRNQKEFTLNFNDNSLELKTIWNEILLDKKQLWILDMEKNGKFFSLKFNGFFKGNRRYFPDIGEKRFTMRFKKITTHNNG